MIPICNQRSMACIFNTILLDLTAAMTDSFEGGGLTGGYTVIRRTYCQGNGAYPIGERSLPEHRGFRFAIDPHQHGAGQRELVAAHLDVQVAFEFDLSIRSL